MKRKLCASLIIAIGGGSCTGKTAIASTLSRELQDNPPVLTLDSYYRDFSLITPEQREEINFDIPDSLDNEMILEHIIKLTQGKTVEKPVYDYATHLRKGSTPLSPSGVFLIIEGLYALYWENIRKITALKVFVDVEDRTAFQRRIERDVRERGITRKYVIKQYNATVEPMFNKHILPTRCYADFILDGTKSIKESVSSIIAAVRNIGNQNK